MIKLELPRYNSIGQMETDFAASAMEYELSGFLGGELRGGKHVRILEENWCRTFGCTHAIAVNSATSGLLAACAAVGVTEEEVILSPYTMSATAAAPAMLGGRLFFVDIEPRHYCIDPELVAKAFKVTAGAKPKVVIATNLFGHPAELKKLARLAHANGAFLIEDNAQAPFATEEGSYAGTIGDIGVFSLNVHKHFQSGEGGVVVTDNDDFAHSVRSFINHGEMSGGPLGLNLRMTEVTAAIAIAQLAHGAELVLSRRHIAHLLIEGLHSNDMVRINPPRNGCSHSYYALAMEVSEGIQRDWMVKKLADYGVPLQQGYVAPLYWLPAFRHFAPTHELNADVFPVAEKMHKEKLVIYENCAYDPTVDQIKEIIDVFDRVAYPRPAVIKP